MTRFEIDIDTDPTTGATATLFTIDEDGRSGDAHLVGVGETPLAATSDLLSQMAKAWPEDLVPGFAAPSATTKVTIKMYEEVTTTYEVTHHWLAEHVFDPDDPDLDHDALFEALDGDNDAHIATAVTERYFSFPDS